jgi:BirA family biotin operon repressor/biotin-[acetyl-CoA-carboxylase] ligase
MPISRQARITRTAISPRFAINTLENTPYLHPMSFSRAKAALAGTRFADLRWVAETGSTNADVLGLLADAVESRPGDRVDLVLVADHQTAGRGRLDRQWDAPPGVSLLMTIGTTRPMEDERRGLVLTAMALAGVEACESIAGFVAKLKWPNDLMAVGVGDDGGDRKIGGVLAEATPLSDGQVGLAVGIGLNCNWGSIHQGLSGIATSLDLLVGREVDREELATGIIDGLVRRLELLDSPDGVGPIVAEARHHSATIGRDIVVHLPAGELEGRAVDLADDGALLVETGGDGVIRRVVVGDVVHVRPRL